MRSDSRRDTARSLTVGLAIVSGVVLVVSFRLLQVIAGLLFVIVAIGLSRRQGWARSLGFGVALYAMGMAGMELLGFLTGSRRLDALVLPIIWGGASLLFLVALAIASSKPATPSA
jgi:hypothetical protein